MPLRTTIAATPLSDSTVAARCDDTFSVLREPKQHCNALSTESATHRTVHETAASEPDGTLDPRWLGAEMTAFAIIGITQIRGGTEQLRNIWYGGAVLVPPFMPSDRDYGVRKNYLAIAPPFVALGVINDYLHRDGAENPRIFLTNFVCFNLGLLWSRKVLNDPGAFLRKNPVQVTWRPSPDADSRAGRLTLNVNW